MIASSAHHVTVHAPPRAESDAEWAKVCDVSEMFASVAEAEGGWPTATTPSTDRHLRRCRGCHRRRMCGSSSAQGGAARAGGR